MNNNNFNEQKTNIIPISGGQEYPNADMQRNIMWLNANYEFKYDKIGLVEMYRKIGGGEYQNFDDRAYNTIKIRMLLNGLKISHQNFDALIRGRYICKEYDPLKEYLYSLTSYTESEGDIVEKFCNQIELEDEAKREYLINYFKKWFVGLIVSIVDDTIDEKKINQLCFVLHGRQGIYKTTLLNKIVPKKLKKYSYTGEFNSHDKDHKLMLATKFFINLDEMSTLNRNSIESIKSAMTLSSVTLRKAYARKEITAKRRASFCGSINRSDFLSDLTGNRRFLIATVKSIKMDPAFNISRLYAYGLHLYKSRYRYWFDAEEMRSLEKNNSSYRTVSVVEELITKFVRKPEPHEIEAKEIDYVTASDINVFLADSERYPKLSINNTIAKTIGQVLAAEGFERVSKRLAGYDNPRRFWVIKYNRTVYENPYSEGDDERHI